MSTPTTRSLVAIFNSRAEFIDALHEALDREGLPTATALLAEIQDGTLDLVAFLEAHDPKVIVYDLPRPFEKHWNFLRLLKQTDGLRKKTGILTTTDKKATHWRRPKTLASQLDQLGVKPTDIKFVAISHTHPDHIGNVELFPRATLLVQKAEYEWPGPNGAGRFKPEHPVTKLEGDYDVFGDGTATL